MAVSTSVSLILALVTSVLIFSTMQIYKPFFASTQGGTILGGFVGSWLFIFFLTAMANLETVMFGKGFQTKLPEVLFCLVSAMAACGMVHRVCATTCLIFSGVAVYFVNKISQRVHSVPTPVEVFAGKKKRK